MAVLPAADMLTQEQAVEIRILARQGVSIRQIGRRMGLSRNTVRRHMSLGLGVTAATQSTRHRIDKRLGVLARSVLGGLHHEYLLTPALA
jgi:transposase